MSAFELIAAEKAEFPIAFMCQRLGVSKSGYYAWQRRGPAARARVDAALTGTIRQIHLASRGIYGAPRVHAELTLGLGLPVNLKRVARLMREAGIQGLYRRRRRGSHEPWRSGLPGGELAGCAVGPRELAQ